MASKKILRIIDHPHFQLSPEIERALAMQSGLDLAGSSFPNAREGVDREPESDPEGFRQRFGFTDGGES